MASKNQSFNKNISVEILPADFPKMKKEENEFSLIVSKIAECKEDDTDSVVNLLDQLGTSVQKSMNESKRNKKNKRVPSLKDNLDNLKSRA